MSTKTLDDDIDPVNAVAATSEIVSSGVNATEGDTVTLGTTVYQLMDTMAAAYDVKIGASAAATLDNLKAAINATGTEGVEYFAGTLVHPDIEATTNTDTVQTIVARVAGVAANDIATTEVAVTLTIPATTLGEGTGNSDPGVDGTIGLAGEVRYNATTFYLCSAVNTIVDANWVKSTLSTF